MALKNESLQKNVLFDVLEAQDLDKNEKSLEAFRKYLLCLKSLADKLFIESYSTDFQTSETNQQYSMLCVMCSERIKHILEHTKKREIQSNYHVSIPSSPVDVVGRQNYYLLQMHQERIKKLPNRDKHLFLNLNLSMQRKMAENIVIAEKHRLSMEKKTEEKIKQILEETERKFKGQSCIGEDEIIRKKIYFEVLQFEMNNKLLTDFRNNCGEIFKTKNSIHDLIENIMSMKLHPLTKFLQGEQFKICFKIKEISEEVNASSENSRDSRFLESVKDDVMSIVKKSFSNVCLMFAFVYEELDNLNNRAILQIQLEPHFYEPLWDFMKDIFRLVMVTNEKNLSSLMEYCKKIDFTPSCVGVSEKLQLTQEKHPYQLVINSFSSVMKQKPIASKLQCLSEAFHSVCQCVKQYTLSIDVTTPEIGADELLPIISYCLIETNIPPLYTECHILMDLTDENQLMGEYGYCLASILTSLDWISKLDIKDIKASDE